MRSEAPCGDGSVPAVEDGGSLDVDVKPAEFRGFRSLEVCGFGGQRLDVVGGGVR